MEAACMIPIPEHDTPPRPLALPMRLAGISHELRTLKRFVVWGYTLQTDEAGAFLKWDKPPRQPRCPTEHASSTNPKTWGTLAEANTALANYPELLDGLGIALGKLGTQLAEGSYL